MAREKISKRILTMFLSTAMAVTMMPAMAFASETGAEETAQAEHAQAVPQAAEEVTTVAEGSCEMADRVTWKLTSDGTLTVVGKRSFPMDSYTDSSKTPWKDYKSQIKKVVIGDNVTGVGNYAFADCENLESVSIEIEKPGTNYAISVGKFSFANCPKLKEVIMSTAVCELKQSAFEGCEGLKEIVMRRMTAPYLYSNAFKGCSNLTIYRPEGASGYDGDKWKDLKVVVNTSANRLAAAKPALLAQAKKDNAFWDLLNRANAGDEITQAEKDAACKTAVEMAEAEYLDTSKLAMAALAINAMGMDASRVKSGDKTVDLIALMSVRVYHNLIANNPKDEMGSELEDWTLALAAYDSGNHSLPSNAVWTREKIIQHILDSQVTKDGETGGWFFFEAGDFDWHTYATAQTLLVLRPYYDENEAVKKAADKAIELIRTKFQETGKLLSSEVNLTENPADAAMVISALRAYGKDVTGDEFTYTAPDGAKMTLVDYLLSLQKSDGTFGPNTNETPYCPKNASALQAVISLEKDAGYNPYLTKRPNVVNESPNKDGYKIPDSANNSVNPNGPLYAFAQKNNVDLKVGETEKLTYKIISGNAGMIKNVTWTSDHPEVAAVDNNGNVKAVAKGEATLKLVITAEAGGESISTVKVTVAEKPAYGGGGGTVTPSKPADDSKDTTIDKPATPEKTDFAKSAEKAGLKARSAKPGKRKDQGYRSAG